MVQQYIVDGTALERVQNLETGFEPSLCSSLLLQAKALQGILHSNSTTGTHHQQQQQASTKRLPVFSHLPTSTDGSSAAPLGLLVADNSAPVMADMLELLGEDTTEVLAPLHRHTSQASAKTGGAKHKRQHAKGFGSAPAAAGAAKPRSGGTAATSGLLTGNTDAQQDLHDKADEQQGFSLGPFGNFLSQQLGLSSAQGQRATFSSGFDLGGLQVQMQGNTGAQQVSRQGTPGPTAEAAVQSAMRSIVSGVSARLL